MTGGLDAGKTEHRSSLRPSFPHPPIHPSIHPTIHSSTPPLFIIGRLLALQAKVDEHSQAITRLKTIWSLVAAGIAFLAAMLKDWLFGSK